MKTSKTSLTRALKYIERKKDLCIAYTSDVLDVLPVINAYRLETASAARLFLTFWCPTCRSLHHHENAGYNEQEPYSRCRYPRGYVLREAGVVRSYDELIPSRVAAARKLERLRKLVETQEQMAATRPAFSAKRPGAKARFAVLRRDAFRCRTCGSSAADGAVLHVDHRTPVAKGGTNDEANLWTLCADCNLGKGVEELH